MRKLLYPLMLLAFAACQQDPAVEVPRDRFPATPELPGEVKGKMYLKFKEMPGDLQVVATKSGVETGDVRLDDAVRKISAHSIGRVFPPAGRFEARTRKEGLHLWYQVVFDEKVSNAEARKVLESLPAVAAVEPVMEMLSDRVEFPYTDEHASQQWYLHHEGVSHDDQLLLPGSDIDAPEAWEIEKGKPNVIVSVIDTRVNFMHPDLQPNLWVNVAELRGQPGVDDDNNGYVDDAFGFNNPYNRDKGTCDPHGTHIAGIIAAKNNNGMGVCGIAGGDSQENGVRVMTSNGISLEALKYSADNGAVIANCSWHQDFKSEILQDAVDYFVKYAGMDENGNQEGPMAGGIVIAAAGNNGSSPVHFWPASFDNVIAVAALDAWLKKTDYSNYADWVDISAPGGTDRTAIFSTFVDRYASDPWTPVYDYSVGTSMAAPVVSGVAALIVSRFQRQGLTPEEVKARLLCGVTPIYEQNPGFEGMLGTGCVNARLALSDEDPNFWPEVTPDRVIKRNHILAYGEEVQYVFTLRDPEGTKMSYDVVDPSEGAVRTELNGDKLTFKIVNRDCLPGDYKLTLNVTDADGKRTQKSISVRLFPELLQEPVVSTEVTDVLTIRAGMRFSGKVKAELFDVSGNLVLEESVEISLSRAGEIDLSALDGGTYTLRLMCNNKTITKNIIKL